VTNALRVKSCKLFLFSMVPHWAMGFFRTMSEGKEVSRDAMQTESPSAQVPTPQPIPARRPSEQERKDFLESDNQTETVEKHRVSCRKCLTWVELGHASSYATGNWVKHKVRCSAAMYVFVVLSLNLRILWTLLPARAAAWQRQSEGCFS
jgi:hypothetical protein